MPNKRWSARASHAELKQMLEHQHFLQHRILERIDTVMATAAEIKAQLTESLAAVRENNTLIGGFGQTLTALETAVTGLESQVAALVADNANDVGSDDVAEISTTIADLKAALADQRTLIENVKANTPAEPAPETDPNA